MLEMPFHQPLTFLTFRKVIVNETTAQDTHAFIHKRLTALKNQRNSGELEDLALIIGMQLSRSRISSFTLLVQMAKASVTH
jgi:phospholipid-transporting ATPase